MARLPKDHGDEGVWGEVLNNYLLTEHNEDGTLKKAADITQAKSDAAAALSAAQSATNTITSHAAASDPHAAASYAILSGGGRRIFVQSSDPASSAQDGDIWIDTSA